MFSKVLLERIKIKSYNKYLSSISNEDFLPGGMSKENFIFLTEKLSPFMKSTFDIKVRIIKKGYLEFIVPFQKHLIGNPLTTALHGGVASTILDHAGGFSAWSALSSPKLMVSTVDLRIDYLAPAKGSEDLVAEGIVIDIGSRLIRSDVILWDKNKLNKLAVGRGTFNVYEINDKSDINTLIEKVKKQYMKNE